MTRGNDDARNEDEVDEASEESFPASDAPAWTGVTGTHAGGTGQVARDGTQVEHNVAALRFEVLAPEGIASLRYRYGRDDSIVLVHTEVPPALEGRGIAGRLARAALEYARDRGLGVVPLCPFVAAYIERHPEFKTLVRPPSTPHHH